MAVSPSYHQALDRWWETVHIEPPNHTDRLWGPTPVVEVEALVWVAQEDGTFLSYGHNPEPTHRIIVGAGGTCQLHLEQRRLQGKGFGPTEPSLRTAMLRAQAGWHCTPSYLQNYHPVAIPWELGAKVVGKDIAFQVRDQEHLYEIVRFYNHHGDSIPERAFLLTGLGEDLTLRTAGEAGACLHALAVGVRARASSAVWCP